MVAADEYNLDKLVEFYRVFQVTAPGFISTHVPEVNPIGENVYAEQGGYDLESSGFEGWVPVNGYSGQWRYHGPIMHDSEFLGGQMARDVLARPGYYVLAPVLWLDEPDEDDNMEGWMLLYKPDPAADDYTEFFAGA